MDMKSSVRLRHEYKYSLDAPQEALYRLKAACLMPRDPNAREDGSYTVSSLYFDDIHDTALRDALRGAELRTKFRIRCYNGDSSVLHLEKKTKLRGLCRKESCIISPEECEKLMRGELPPFGDYCPEEKKALMTELITRGLMPKLIISFQRFAFVYSGGNVRVTLDRDICASDEVGKFLTGGFAQRPILPLGSSLMEVKWDELLPRHIRDALSLDSLTWTAFSKYVECRKNHI